jgi:hypothetical protein
MAHVYQDSATGFLPRFNAQPIGYLNSSIREHRYKTIDTGREKKNKKQINV